MYKKISILIRNKNESNSLKIALVSVQQQNLPQELYEIIVIDDNSTDNSKHVSESFGCQVYSLPNKFTYGYAINYGLTKCNGDIVLLLSSHNFILGKHFLSDLLEYFQDEKIAAIRCTPISDRHQVLHSMKPIILNSGNFSSKTHWSDLIIANCSAIKRKVALKYPFDETIISNEEKLWSLKIIEAGYSIYSNIPCFHYYFQAKGLRRELKNQYRDYVSKYEILGIKYLGTIDLARAIMKTIGGNFISSVRSIYFGTLHAVKLFLIPFNYKRKY